jgi:hypothetical protein
VANPNLRQPLALLLAVALYAAIGGCQGRREPVRAVPATVDTGIQRVVLLPFVNMYRVYGKNVSFTCPLCGNTYLIDEVAEGGDQFMTDELLRRLLRRSSFETVPPSQARGVRSALLQRSLPEVSELQLVLETGRALDADAVVMGRVYRFSELSGNQYTANNPASVTFDILLVRVPDGRLLWEQNYQETQKPLSDDLLQIKTFFKRSAKWLTARELATYGLDATMASFPLP